MCPAWTVMCFVVACVTVGVDVQSFAGKLLLFLTKYFASKYMLMTAWHCFISLVCTLDHKYFLLADICSSTLY